MRIASSENLKHKAVLKFEENASLYSRYFFLSYLSTCWRIFGIVTPKKDGSVVLGKVLCVEERLILVFFYSIYILIWIAECAQEK